MAVMAAQSRQRAAGADEALRVVVSTPVCSPAAEPGATALPVKVLRGYPLNGTDDPVRQALPMEQWPEQPGRPRMMTLRAAQERVEPVLVAIVPVATALD